MIPSSLTRRALAAIALAVATALLVPTGAAAQKAGAARLPTATAVPVVSLADDFGRLARYNEAVEAANGAHVRAAQAAARTQTMGVATVVLAAVVVTQYIRSTQLMDSSSGNEWEVPGLIASLSIGGAIWTGAKFFEARDQARGSAAAEQGQLQRARDLMPGHDPAARRR